VASPLSPLRRPHSYPIPREVLLPPSLRQPGEQLNAHPLTKQPPESASRDLPGVPTSQTFPDTAFLDGLVVAEEPSPPVEDAAAAHDSSSSLRV
jgi:hypothetical protein